MAMDLEKETNGDVSNNALTGPRNETLSGNPDATSDRSSVQDVPQDVAKAPYNPMTDPSSFPDGGSAAWLAVAGAAACFFVSWGWINCVGVFQEYYMREPLSQYTPSEVAWIPSTETFFMLFTGPFAGKFFDDYGPKYLLVVGTILHVFGLMMTSLSKKYYQFFLSQAVCSPIGASLIFTAGISCVPTWFFKKRGMALGLAASGSSLGGVIFPIIVSRMIKETGFGWAMRTCAFLILAMCIFAIFTLRSRLPPSKRPFTILGMIRPLREPPMALTTLAAMLFYFGMFPVFSFVTTVATGRGMSIELAQYLVSILNAGSIFGRTLPGILGDKIGRYNVMIIFNTLTFILIFALWIPTTGNVGELIFAPLFGFTSGAAIGLTGALIAQISPVREIGLRSGMVFAAGSLGALTGAPIGGQLITENNGKFLYMMCFGGSCCAAGSILFIVARINIAGTTLKKKV
jgi:MFS family permease